MIIKPTEKKYTAKEIFSEKEVKEVKDNPNHSNEVLDSSTNKDKNIDESSSNADANSSNENKDIEESKNE